MNEHPPVLTEQAVETILSFVQDAIMNLTGGLARRQDTELENGTSIKVYRLTPTNIRIDIQEPSNA
jgi:hypothetical protein